MPRLRVARFGEASPTPRHNGWMLHELEPFVGGDVFRVVVESPRGSAVKLKFDPEIGAMTVSRPLTGGLTYPFDWGFVPGTQAADGDPLDAMLLWDTSTFPGVVVPCRAIGLVQLDQRKKTGRGRERNDRILAVPVKAPRMDHIRTARDLPARQRRELEEFFVQATALTDKDVRVLGWAGRAAALQHIRRSLKERSDVPMTR
jgi:inorganic pyrophosphatase